MGDKKRHPQDNNGPDNTNFCSVRECWNYKVKDSRYCEKHLEEVESAPKVVEAPHSLREASVSFRRIIGTDGSLREVAGIPGSQIANPFNDFLGSTGWEFLVTHGLLGRFFKVAIPPVKVETTSKLEAPKLDLEAEEVFRDCAGCNGEHQLKHSRQYGASDPTRFCTKRCEDRFNDRKKDESFLLTCYTPWMTTPKVGETFKYLVEEQNEGRAWIDHHIVNTLSFEGDFEEAKKQTYELLEVIPSVNRNGEGTSQWKVKKLITSTVEPKKEELTPPTPTFKTIIKRHNNLTPVGKVLTITRAWRVDNNTVQLNGCTPGNSHAENPYDTFDGIVGKSFKILEVLGDTWRIEEVPALKEEASTAYNNIPRDMSSFAVKVSEVNSFEKENSSMNGKLYKGVVVRNKTVQAGEGVSTGVQQTEVVFEQNEAFIAPNDETARAQILVDAKLKLGTKLDRKDTLQPLEVKLTVSIS